MKYRMVITCDSEEELEAITYAMKNKAKVDCMYDDVFRPIIKYSENEREVKAFRLVWETLKDYLDA
jgi:predicted kinase